MGNQRNYNKYRNLNYIRFPGDILMFRYNPEELDDMSNFFGEASKNDWVKIILEKNKVIFNTFAGTKRSSRTIHRLRKCRAVSTLDRK